jgi:hypothetical protein
MAHHRVDINPVEDPVRSLEARVAEYGYDAGMERM